MNHKNNQSEHLVIYGGTFSPVHADHIRLARELSDLLHPSIFLFLPNKAPVLDKVETATAVHRVNMLTIAIAPWIDTYPFQIDTREIDRPSRSYMYLTLDELRKQYPDAMISLVMGMDSYLSFPRWKHPERIQAHCNLVVVDRPGYARPSGLIEYDAATVSAYGGVYLCETSLCQQDVSSTLLRQGLKAGINPKETLPSGIWSYIHEHGLYGAANSD